MLYYALCELDCGVRYITRTGYNRFARELPSLGATLNYIKLDLKVALIAARLQFPSICSDLMLICSSVAVANRAQHPIVGTSTSTSTITSTSVFPFPVATPWLLLHGSPSIAAA